jgi:hypothetical protein
VPRVLRRSGNPFVSSGRRPPAIRLLARSENIGQTLTRTCQERRCRAGCACLSSADTFWHLPDASLLVFQDPDGCCMVEVRPVAGLRPFLKRLPPPIVQFPLLNIFPPVRSRPRCFCELLGACADPSITPQAHAARRLEHRSNPYR